MKTVSDIMTPDPKCCTPDADLHEVARLMCESDVGEIPVVESEDVPRLVGVITDRDIVCRTVAEGRNPLRLRARDCMTFPCFTVAPEDSVESCCEVLEKRRIRRVPVVDEGGFVRGIVSQADIALKTDAQKTAEVVSRISVHA